MKKNDWEYLAKAMWNHSEINKRRKISRLLKQLIKEIHENSRGERRVIIDDMENINKVDGSDGQSYSDATSENDFNGAGEF
jgi:hypothetical protein